MAVLLSALLSGVVCIAVDEYRRPITPLPHDGPVDPHFVAVGRSYNRELGKAYAGAIRVGVTELSAGVPASQVFTDVGKDWNSRRQAAFDQVVTPELSKVLPESTEDAAVTPAQRAALAAALRGLAQGVAP